MAENPIYAFPATSGEVFYEPGMTLRDYFAGQALPAYAVFGPNGHAPAAMIAAAAYELADAMLAARTQDNTDGR